MDVLDVDVYDTVKEILLRNSKADPASEVDDELTLGELGCDSLDLMQIVNELEEAFDEISEEEVAVFNPRSRVSEIVSYCNARFGHR